jgi:hypothetical protein
VAPGARNDGFGDVIRDALSFGAARGCHPTHYAPVVRPLLAAWLAILLLRLFRNRQAVWQTR